MSLRGRFDREVAAAVTGPAPVAGPPVTESDLAGLPETARRYLRFMGVVGRPVDRSCRAHLVGRFRRGPKWTRCEAWQWISATPVTRIFHLRLAFAPAMPMYATDAYVDGRGRMRGTVAGVTVADGQGHEFDVGELVTFLKDAVVFAPSMLLRLPVTWTPVDNRSFGLVLVDRGITVRGRVRLTADGAPRDFTTEDRYADLPEGLTRTRWSTPVMGWTTGPRPKPLAGSAVWHLPSGPLTYAEFDFAASTVEHNPTA